MSGYRSESDMLLVDLSSRFAMPSCPSQGRETNGQVVAFGRSEVLSTCNLVECE